MADTADMPHPALVICDGSLASTVGALLEAERCPPVAWVAHPSAGLLPPTGHDHETTLAMVRRQADLRGFAEVLDAGTAGTHEQRVGRFARPIALLEALRASLEHACDRVIWPVACGSDLDALSTTAERALLITRLAWLEEGTLTGPAPQIETPLLDVAPRALEEMAADLDLAPGTWLEPLPACSA